MPVPTSWPECGHRIISEDIFFGSFFLAPMQRRKEGIEPPKANLIKIAHAEDFHFTNSEAEFLFQQIQCRLQTRAKLTRDARVCPARSHALASSASPQ
jgi:hypothetical protein